MIKPMWDAKAVKAYETGQGVELVNEPHPHYEPVSNGDTLFRQFMSEAEKAGVTHLTPPQRTWVGLTDEEIASIYMNHTDRPMHAHWDFARSIEAKLKEKNT